MLRLLGVIIIFYLGITGRLPQFGAEGSLWQTDVLAGLIIAVLMLPFLRDLID